MSLILHFTDLHSLAADHDVAVSDYKSNILPDGERLQRQRLLRNTLTELGRSLTRNHMQLDAVVVTGDITNRGEKAGFDLLPELLLCLGNSAVPSNRVVVLPGNHDIVRGSEASSVQRYKTFMDLVSEQGYIAPSLEGIDIDSEGMPLSLSHYPDSPSYAPEKHYLLDLNQKWLLVPINCANYYGSLEPLDGISEASWISQLNKSSRGTTSNHAFKKYIEKLRNQDVARVSLAQMNYVRNLMLDIEQKLHQDHINTNELIRIALIHHHLLPVSSREEFKPFEALINLGSVRQFLKTQRFDIVLHGHKHTSFVYRDFIYDGVEGIEGLPHKIVVISGTTLEQGSSHPEVLRLLKLETPQFTPSLDITNIPAVNPGDSLKLKDIKPLRVKLYESYNREQLDQPSPKFVSGRTACDVYARMLILFENHVFLENLTCHISDSTTIADLADLYPKPLDSTPSDATAWFNDVVQWWQCPTVKVGNVPFNHGNRIHHYRGVTDQLQQVIQQLSTEKSPKTPSSRATMVLIDPSTDGTEPLIYPSLCLIQFILRPEHQVNKLDCIGYFRKQEMKFWWPINVAELATLQREVYEAISYMPTEIGTLTTVAAIATKSAGNPRVAIPAVDRAFDLHRDELWAMIYSLFSAKVNDRSDYEGRWNTYLDDLVPRAARDVDGVPIALPGLEFLLSTAELFASHEANATVNSFIIEMRSLVEKNSNFAKSTKYGSTASSNNYNHWEREVSERVEKLKRIIKAIFSNNSTSF